MAHTIVFKGAPVQKVLLPPPYTKFSPKKACQDENMLKNVRRKTKVIFLSRTKETSGKNPINMKGEGGGDKHWFKAKYSVS